MEAQVPSKKVKIQGGSLEATVAAAKTTVGDLPPILTRLSLSSFCVVSLMEKRSLIEALEKRALAVEKMMAVKEKYPHIPLTNDMTHEQLVPIYWQLLQVQNYEKH